MLKAMANFIRPAQAPADRRPTRHHTRSRSPPPAADLAKPAEPHLQQSPTAPILTRRLSKTLTLPPRVLDQPNNASEARHTTTGARKRSFTEVDAANARPPSKKLQRRSQGESPNATTHEPTKTLKVKVEHVRSGASTPRHAGTSPAPHQTTSSTADKKSLRSQDPNSRRVSELRDIFDDYETIIADFDDRESSLSNDDQIYIVDEPLSAAELAELEEAATNARAMRAPPDPNHIYTPRAPFDYTPYANALSATEDPLADEVYIKIHDKHERKEKNSRNIDNERSKHQKSQVERLLDELEGDDWPKVFVVAGTLADRLDWERKRQYFIKELRTLIGKHEAWRRSERENEKKKKENEKAKREREKKRRRDDGEEVSDSDSDPKPKRSRRKEPSHRPSPHPHPNATSPPKPRRPPRPHGFILEYEPTPASPQKFKSFFKPGTRPASLSGPNTTKSKSTRSAAAPPFGVPLPQILTRIEDAELGAALMEDNRYEVGGEPTEGVLRDDEQRFWVFGLGEKILTEEVVRGNERRRRRRKRESTNVT